MKRARVAVLLSAYNGEKYLREQIESVLGQTHPDFYLLARDDGSADSSPAILDSFEQTDSRVRVLRDGERLGYPECFYALLRAASDADYFAFCDQDDWWHPEKLARAVTALEARGGSAKPLLTFCESELCDASLSPVGARKAPGELGLAACALNGSMAPGYAIVITRALRDIALPRIQNTSIHHDRLFCRAAAYLGEIVPDSFAGAKHRLHGESHTAARMPGSGSKSTREDAVWKTLRAENAEFLSRFSDVLPPAARREIARFSTGGKWMRALYPKRLRRGLRGEIRLRLRYLREQ